MEGTAAASEGLRGRVWGCVFGADEEGTWLCSWFVVVGVTESKGEAEGASMVQFWCGAVALGGSIHGESGLVGDKGSSCLVLVFGCADES